MIDSSFVQDQCVEEEFVISSKDCLSFYMPVLANKVNERNALLNESANVSISCNKRVQEKYHVLNEILSSEKKYLNDLKEIIEGYYDEINNMCEVVKRDDHDRFISQIFSNIKEIYEFTGEFYLMLEGSTNNEIDVANCFIKAHSSFFKLYSVYCQNYVIAYNVTENLENDPIIGKILQKVRSKYGHSLKMATYLQLPVLRITKYHLLLQRYLKLLEKESFTYNQVLEALNLMKQVNDEINKNMPDFYDNNHQIKSSNGINNSHIEVIFERNSFSFNNLYGNVLKQGNLFLNETNTMHYVIVYETMFILKKSYSSTSKILHSIPNEYLGFLPSIDQGSSPTKKKQNYLQSSITDVNQPTIPLTTSRSKTLTNLRSNLKRLKKNKRGTMA